MASYSPPSEILSIFNPYVFQSSNSNSDITKSYLQSNYLKYPTTQTGIINIAGTIINTNSGSNTIFGYGSSLLGTNNTGFGYATY